MSAPANTLAELADRISHKASTLLVERDGEATILKGVKASYDEPEKAMSPDEEKAGFGLWYTISDGGVDDDKDTIDPKGWELEDFKACHSPVLLNHDSRSASSLPVARAPKTALQGSTLRSYAEFPSVDLNPFGNMVGRMALHKFGLGGASVGFKPHEWKFNADRGSWAIDYLRQKLREWSITPIPCNTRAVQDAKSFGIDVAPLLAYCEQVLDEGGTHILVPRKHLERIFAATKSASGEIARVFLPFGLEGLAIDLEKATTSSPFGESAEFADAALAVAEKAEEAPEAKTDPAPAETDPAPAEGTDEPAPACELCERKILSLDGVHIVGEGKAARMFTCKADSVGAALPPEPKDAPAPAAKNAPTEPEDRGGAADGDNGGDAGNDDPAFDRAELEAMADKAVQELKDAVGESHGVIPDF